jgi:uncharacterized protein YfbU (UPF0304 family)
MKLSPETRWILANQYRLLELNDSDEGMRDHYRHAVVILERGYELEYGTLAESIQDPMSEEECREVYDILEMHSDLMHAYKELGDASGVDEAAVEFRGFDGNEEGRIYSYARFLIADLGKWEDLAPTNTDGFNSHFPVVAGYRRMLPAWRQWRADRLQDPIGLRRKPWMTPEEIKRIVEAR